MVEGSEARQRRLVCQGPQGGGGGGMKEPGGPREELTRRIRS